MNLTYHFKHGRNFSEELNKAKLIADYAVKNKRDKKKLSSKFVKHFGLKSAISNQILRKYGNQKKIKEAKNVGLIVPNQGIKFFQDKSIVKIPCLKLKFRWSAGRPIEKICQIEISKDKFYITCKFSVNSPEDEEVIPIGVDVNASHHVAVCSNMLTGDVLKIGKQGPNIRKTYFKKRQKAQSKKDMRTLCNLRKKEYRKLKDLDHKISDKIVKFAKESGGAIILEDIKGIRRNIKKNKGSRGLNRLVSSWSFFRLQGFIEYKAKLNGIKTFKVPPHHTSQLCSRCGILGKRKGKKFVCEKRRCLHEDHADVNASFNISRRYLGEL